MFKWLADMIVKTPVQGSCSCCEGKKERLKKMQEVIFNEKNGNESEEIIEIADEEGCGCGGGSCATRKESGHECKCGGKGHDGQECDCGDDCQCKKNKSLTFSSSYSAHYRFDKASSNYNRTVEYGADEAQKDR